MKQLKFLVFIWLSCLAMLSHADPQLGKEYGLVTQPQPTEPKKIEVQEFFSYSCPHCFDLDPQIHQWSKKLPKDVTFTRLHAASNPNWASLAKLFYALEALGELERLHSAVFTDFHQNKINFSDEKTAIDWLSKHGVDPKKYADASASFSVQGKIARTKQLAEAYGINGVPTIVVGGKYQTSASMTGSHEATLKVAEYLINLVRRERGGK